MKTLLKYALPYCLFIGLIFSCKDDEVVDPLLGTWTLYSETAKDCNDPADEYSNLTPCTDSECVKVTIKSDGTLEVRVKEEGVTVIMEGTYTKNGNQITVCMNDSCDEPATYTIVNKTFTMTAVDSESGCTFVRVMKK